MGIKEIGLLDSALCSHTHRTSFLNAWKEEQCVFADEVFVTDLFATWVVKRNIRFSILAVPESLMLGGLHDSFFQTTCSSVTKLKYPRIVIKDDAIQQQMATPQIVLCSKRLIEKASTCTTLQSLIVSRIDMSKVDLRAVLTNCKNLKTVMLRFANFIDLDTLHKYGTNIETLDLSHCDACAPIRIGADSSSAAVTTNLRKLTMRHSYDPEVHENIAKFICAHGGLQELCVVDFDFTDIACILRSCPLLTTLSAVLRCDFDDIDAAGNVRTLTLDNAQFLIKHMQNMRYLHLCQRFTAKFISDKLLLVLLRGCRELVVLITGENADQPYLTERTPPVATAISTNNSNTTETTSPATSSTTASTPSGPVICALQELRVDSISAKTLSQVLHLCPSLADLGIDGFEDVSEFEDTVQIVRHTKIHKLALYVPSESRLHNIHLLHDLHSLTLLNAEGLTDPGVRTIAQNNPLLVDLTLEECHQVSTAAICELVTSCTRLLSLNILDEHMESVERFTAIDARLHALNPMLRANIWVYDHQDQPFQDAVVEEGEL